MTDPPVQMDHWTEDVLSTSCSSYATAFCLSELPKDDALIASYVSKLLPTTDQD